MRKPEDKRTPNGHLLISAEIIEKTQVGKNGKIPSETELYVRRSIGDYFIKFCESAVSKEEIKKEIAKINSEIKTLTIETEIRNGPWDTCGNAMQSRTGPYIIIHRLIDPQ